MNQQSHIRHCISCDTDKPSTAFIFKVDKRWNRGYYDSSCRACRAEKAKSIAAAQRESRDWLRLVSLVGNPPCDWCLLRHGCKTECDRFLSYVESGPHNSPHRIKTGNLA